MTKTDPTPTVDLEEVRRYHYETVQDDCANCGTVWPCDAIKLADEVERLREDNEEWKEDIDKQTENFVNACERVDRLREALEYCANPTIGLGDFNDAKRAIEAIKKIARAALEEDNE